MIISGYFSAYSRIIATELSVEQSSCTIATKRKFVFCVTKPSKQSRKYGSWLYTRHFIATNIDSSFFFSICITKLNCGQCHICPCEMRQRLQALFYSTNILIYDITCQICYVYQFILSSTLKLSFNYEAFLAYHRW